MITRDQQRAKHAYERVEKVPEKEQNDYKVHVNSFGANILRSGLAAAVGFLERDKAWLFLDHMADAGIPNLQVPRDESSDKRACEERAREFSKRVRELELADYMLATREALKIALWFRRAIQAQAWGKEQGDEKSTS